MLRRPFADVHKDSRPKLLCFYCVFLLFSSTMVTNGLAFEVQRIPSPATLEREGTVEKFKSLSPEKQKQLWQKYEKTVRKEELEKEKGWGPDEREEIEEKEVAAEGVEEELSAFEKFVAGRLPEEISLEVRQFGYDLFEAPPSTFAPTMTAPVTVDYVIGPQDEIKINLWGKVETEMTTIVDREGNITLPSVGVVNVAGLTFKELKEYLRRKFSKYYSGFQINVTLSSLRTIKVFVVGKARSPGSYDISGLSTLINALFASGGPSKIGSMRKIQLIRDRDLVTELDLYDFIFKGDKSKDVQVQPNDVILVPTVGDLVAVIGNVRAPAIYELRGKTRITDALDMAGGVMATGYLHRVQVERIVDNQFKAVTDKNISDIKEEDNIALRDGDIVKVFPISGAIVNAVNLRGNVSRPGTYEWHEGLKVSDVIRRKDLLPDTLYDFAKIERLLPPHNEIGLIHFDLEKALSKDPKEDMLLKAYDTITIYNKWELKEKPVVRISGAVNMWGGPRQQLGEKPTATPLIEIEKVEEQLAKEYEYKEGMKLSDLIKLAGGLKRYAYNEAEITRVHVTQAGPVTERWVADISTQPDGSLAEDVVLEPDDYVFVRTVPDWYVYNRATIEGEVLFPGTYPTKKGERLADLIIRAGGFTEAAYLKGSVFTRKSVQETQQKMLEQAIDRFEREVLSATATKTATAYSEEEANILEGQARQYEELVRRLREVRAIGRLVIGMAPVSVLRHTPANVELEDGDVIFIPSKLATINVLGSVYNPSTYLYDPETKADSYVEMAGGPTESADTDKTYVLKVDGSALSQEKLKGGLFSWNTKTYRWEVGSPSKTRLDPGDTIIVPEKFDRLALMRNVKDVSQLLFQMAVTAGVVVALF